MRARIRGRRLPDFGSTVRKKPVYWIEHRRCKPALATLFRKPDAIHVTLELEASAAARCERAISKKSGADTEAANPINFSFTGAPDKRRRLAHQHVDGASFTAFPVAPWRWLYGFLSAQIFGTCKFPNPLAGIAAHHSSEGSSDRADAWRHYPTFGQGRATQLKLAKPLLVMEAMKMEHAIKAPYDGVVKAYKFGVGDQVKDRDLLVEFEESA